MDIVSGAPEDVRRGTKQEKYAVEKDIAGDALRGYGPIARPSRRSALQLLPGGGAFAMVKGGAGWSVAHTRATG